MPTEQVFDVRSDLPGETEVGRAQWAWLARPELMIGHGRQGSVMIDQPYHAPSAAFPTRDWFITNAATELRLLV